MREAYRLFRYGRGDVSPAIQLYMELKRLGHLCDDLHLPAELLIDFPIDVLESLHAVRRGLQMATDKEVTHGGKGYDRAG